MPFDPGPEFQEFRVDLLIAAMDVMRAANRGHAAGGKGGKDKRRAGPKIADLDLGSVERRGAVYQGVVLVLDLDVGAHTA